MTQWVWQEVGIASCIIGSYLRLEQERDALRDIPSLLEVVVLLLELLLVRRGWHRPEQVTREVISRNCRGSIGVEKVIAHL